MEFSEYYKNKQVVESYEERRKKGLKSHIVRALERQAISSLLIGTGSNILEAGVGTGFITEILRKHGKVSGFDISPEMIKRTKSRFPDMEIQEADILNLALKKKYGTIVSVRVISHFKPKDAKKAISNLASVLQPRGNIIFNLENPSVIRRLARKITHWGSTETFQYSNSVINDLTISAGLKITDRFYIDHLFILPLHILNKILFSSLDNAIFNLEKKLSSIKFLSNNVFLKCQK